MPDRSSYCTVRRCLLAGILLTMLAGTALAQPLVVQQTWRPRIAMAPDGSSAVAYEALVDDIILSWKVAVQRFAPNGTPVGPTHFFRGESCGQFDIWTSDFMAYVDLAFQSDGTLLVSMTHDGELSLGGVDGSFTAETTLGAIAADGSLIDANNSGNCVQAKVLFINGEAERLPQLAVGPNDAIFIIQQGGFENDQIGDNWTTNVAMKVLDAAGNELVDQFIPHTDPTSRQALHAHPDIAAAAGGIVAVWHQCPLLDNQGNVNDCDIGAQFFDAQGQPAGGNVTVNDAGAGQPGTFSLWPSVAMNAAGQSVVVWADDRTGDQGDVFAQRFDAAGQPIGGNIQVSTGQGNLYQRPEVALLNDGRFMVVWDDSTNAGAFTARGRRFAADGTPEGPPTPLVADPTLDTGFASVSTNGTAYVFLALGDRDDGTVRAVVTSNLGVLVSNEQPDAGFPADFSLDGYPNPFTGRATIRYEVPVALPVRLVVYDLLGREVVRLVDRVEAPGRHEVDLDGRAWPAGPYFIRLQQGERIQTRVLVRR